MRLKIVIEDTAVFSVNSVRFLLIRKTDVQKSMTLNFGTLVTMTCKYQRTPTVFVNMSNGITIFRVVTKLLVKCVS